MRLAGAILLGLLVVAGGRVGALAAQVGVTTDILTGAVTDSTGAPIAGATVEAASLETGMVRSATTDGRGRYRILFPDGGGRYQLFARQIGMMPARLQVERQGDDDRLVADIRLNPQALALEDIVTVARRLTSDQRPGPGSTETVETPERLARLPIDASDLNAIAALAPGVVSIGGTDSTAAGFSAAGQRPTANATTLDGLTFGASSIPQDAVRSIRVITNTYDVARGQFSGGLVASTTRSGTSVFQATGNASLRDPALAVVPDTVDNLPQAQQQFSFGVGGPLIPNRFFGFGAGQIRHRSNDLISLLTLEQGGAERYGVSQDSLDRYAATLGSLGIPVTGTTVPDSRAGTDISGIGRLDLLLSKTQTLTLRGDYRHSDDAPTRLAPLAPPASGGFTSSSGGGVMLQLSSQLGQSFLNEAKAYLSGTANSGDPYLRLPQGRLQLSSSLPDGSISTSTLTFGGNNGFPQRGHSTTFEGTNEISWLSPDASHRVKFGLFLNTSRTTSEVASNQLGTFTYLSLADLAAGQPALFTRTLGADQRTGLSSTAAAYLGDTWRPSRGWQLAYGVRAEHSWFGDPPGYNGAVDSLFGLRTDQLPRETHVSPRAGFTWTAPASQGPSPWIVRGGAGEFRSPIPPNLAVAAQAASGTANGQIQLVCAGPDAPSPDWSAMAADPSTIPTSCVGGGTGTAATGAPSVTAFAPGFTAPRVWRGSLGVQHRTGLLTFSLDLSAGLGVSQMGYLDRNIGPAQFTLANEGGREVYAPASAIDPGTGTVSLVSSRLDPAFGQVFEAISSLTTRSVQGVLSVSGIVGHGITVSASYTLSRATDQSSSSGFGGPGFASQTVGRTESIDPRSTSDFDRRHQIVTTMTVPLVRGLEITTIARVSSGAPFTPSVAGDINADGSRGDRAFIFNPQTATDPAVAADMARLLATAPGRLQDCLMSQLGTIAQRNSCRGPWQPSLDLQLNWRPTMFGLDQRLTISILTANLLAGLDELFHGDDNLHGWGEYTRPDPTLLTVRGFDPATQQFIYDVNGRFGSITGSQTIRQPFQIGIQLRLALGGVPGFSGALGGPGGGGEGRQGGFRQGGGGPGFGGGPAGGAGGAGGAAFFAERLGRMLPDPIKPITDLNIQLHLTDDQLAKLTAISHEFTQRRDSIGREIQSAIEKEGPQPDRAVLLTRIRTILESGRGLAAASLEEAKGVLSAGQWAQLPEDVKSPPRPGGGFGGRPRQ